MLYALKFLCVVVLLAIFGPFYLLSIGNAALGDYLNKRRVRCALSSTHS